MIQFDKTKFEITKLDVISFSAALGGSVRYMVGEREIRADLPFAVARKLTKRYGARFLHAKEFQVVKYDGHIISLDAHSYAMVQNAEETNIPLGDTDFISEIRKGVDQIKTGDWSFDGRFIFKLDNIAKNDQVALTEDGILRACSATCIDLQAVPGEEDKEDDEADDSIAGVVGARDCIVAYGPNGTKFVSPPVWLRLSQIRKASEQLDPDKVYYQIDEISKKYQLSLDFILNAAKVIGYNFGYNAMLPLRIPHLMVSLNTINLAKIDKAARKRIDAGISITHALLFLLGFIEKTKDLQVYIQIKQLLKHTVGRWTTDNNNNTVNVELIERFQQVKMLPHETIQAMVDRNRDQYTVDQEVEA